MKKLTKGIFAGIALSMAAFAFAPTVIPVTEAAAVQELPAPVIEKPAEIGKVKQISDYLFVVRYSDLKTDLMNSPETGLGSLFLFRGEGSAAKVPGCSAVVNGAYYGRNLDALWDLTSGMKADVKLIYASQMIGALGDYGNRLIATLENAAAFHPDFRFSTDLNDQDSPDDPSEKEPENDPLI